MSSFTTPLTAYNPEQVGDETTSDGKHLVLCDQRFGLEE
jgi:hypothetical protein